MTQMTKRLLILFAAVASTTVLAACNQPSATNTTEEPAAEQASEPAEATNETVVEVEVDPATEAVATDETDTTATPTASEDTAEAGNIVEIASGDSTFSTLVAAIEAADLAEALSAEGPYTVFAPTDEAFAALPEGTVDELLKPENKDQLITLLTYHVVPAKVLSTEIEPGAVETVEGEPLEIAVDPDTNEVKVNDATVVKTDIVGSNGVIHVVDKVILPPSAE
ncbi:MAG: fasciclin domain-containing protein [Cyanobacteria bacterium J06592_8]